MKLTPELLAAAYTFLRSAEPFKAWKMPESGEIVFKVVGDPKKYADFSVESGVPVIRVSEKMHRHTETILMTLAHEAIHLHQFRKKLDRGGMHNADFRRRAKRVCAIHGWDEAIF